MKPSLMRKPPARPIASRSGTAQWCSIRRSAAAESFGISSMMSQASSSSKALMPSARRLGARYRARFQPSSPSMPRPISAPIVLPSSIASSLERLLRCCDLDLSVGVLVHRQRVDHAHGVALAQALELLDDLAVELGVAEAEHDELNWSDCHVLSLRSTVPWARPLSLVERLHASSTPGVNTKHRAPRGSRPRTRSGREPLNEAVGVQRLLRSNWMMCGLLPTITLGSGSNQSD